ncbi:hypothetical protein EDD16DRAFT_1520258 [Pisolithus croceorrhizus]|nr:hypothetical protein EDD16DRAFT_1520258 [Pisolithus croceorrhizus]
MFSLFYEITTALQERGIFYKCWSVHALALSNDGNILARRYRRHQTLEYQITQRTYMCQSSPTAQLVVRPGSKQSIVPQKHFVMVQEWAIWYSCDRIQLTWIAIGMRDNVVQVLLLNSNSQLQSVFAGRLEHTVPKSVAFTQRGNIYIFGLYDVIDNVRTIHLYPLERERSDPVLCHRATKVYPKQVAFGEESKLLLGGSDNGSVYLFEEGLGGCWQSATQKRV